MHSYLSLRRFRTLAFIISAMFLWGCVGEGDGPQRIPGTPAAAQTGVLIDAPVSGVSYQGSSDLSGLTNDMGEFQYRPFDLVTFSIGGIVLGTAQGAPYITVVELTNSVDPTSVAATNMLVFLQSIDADGDPTNGITISASTRTAAAGRSLDFFAADFDSQVAATVAAIAPGNSVISASDALFNFYQAYAELGGTDTFDFGFPGFPPVGGGLTFELIFADEFNGDTLSAANWNIETGYGPSNDGWGNNEWQLYTDSADNLRVEDGNLVISAQCPTPPCGVRDGTVTSARINSLDKVEFRYGKIIARIKPPVGAGTWPAFWSMGANFPEIGWPRSGEIDFMEMFAGVSDSRTTHSTIHWCDENFAPPLPALCFPEANGKRAFTQSRTFAESLGDDFHIWETDWTPGRITVSMDGVQYFDAFIDPATQEEFLRDFFLIFNVAMGGTAGSNEQPPNGTEVFPQTMLVDYVRVYQQVGDGPAGDVLVDFEADPASYDFGQDAGFGGGASVVIANPDPSGINTTAQVARMQKFPAEVFGGSTLSLGSNLNFAQGQVFKMKVWATRLVPVLFKLEDTTSEPPIPENGLERFVDHTGSGMWEELCFDFTGATANFTSSKITFIFDLGVLGDATNNPDAWTFYYDEIEQTDSCDGDGGGESTATDFESGTATFSDFEGGVGSVIDNPDATGINTSAKVGQMQKFAGAVFGGTTLTLGAAETLAAGASYTMKVRASRAVPVLFKLEGGAVGEVEVNHSGSGTWEELCFDFTGIAGNVSGITLIFDISTAGAAGTDPDNWTFQFDDIQQIDSCPTGGGGGGVAVTDFESGTATFSDFEGGVGSVIDNPDATGINTSAKVGQMQKFAGAVFGGTTLTLGAAETLAAGASYTMKVRASRAVPVLFKLEGGAVGEVEVNHSGSGAWEELCFDFTGIAGNVSGITLIFDISTAGAAGTDPANWTFQFDDIQQVDSCPTGGGGGTATVTDFESGTATFSDFEGGAGSVIDNPDVSGINTSAKVGQMQKFAGAVFGGTTLTLDVAETLAAGDSYTMKVRASRAVPVLFKLEGGAVGEVEVNHSGSGTWEELCFDFTGVAGNVSGITLIFDISTSGAAGTDPANWTFQFDDIQQIESCPTGGGGGGSGLATVDFEASGVGAGFTWSVFENGDNPALEIVANPAADSINGSATVAKFTARVAGQPFAGVETAHGDFGPLTLDASNAIVKVMVYKTVVSDVGIKFAIANGGAQPEIKVANTQINQWEELTFDFSSYIGLVEAINIDQLIVFPDFQARSTENIVYFDNISFSGTGTGGGGGGGGVAVTDFESGTATFGDFEGGVGSVIDNPDATGINTSTKVGQMQKFAGATFAGTTLTLDAAETLAAGTSYTMKVRASRAVPVLFKLEGGAVGEVTVNHSGSGTWEELCFDFTGIAGNVSAITLIFDNGVAGDAANNAADWTFQFDDIQQIESCPTGGGGGAITDAVVDFEPGGLGADLTWAVFENGPNPALEFVVNPDNSGINNSATVAKFTARVDGATFAGTNTQDLPTFTLDASNAIVKIMVYKTVISDVGLKFEQGQASTGEIKVANTLTNQWEELTFDFSGKIGEPSSSDITGFVVFPDFDARAQDNVIYFDNISFSAVGGGGGTATVTDFESGTATFGDFEGGVGSVIDNPDATGINTSTKVGQMQKFAGATFAGTTLTLDAAETLAAGTSYTMKVRASRAVPVLFKLEGGAVGEVTVNHSGSGTWEELCFDFTGIAGNVSAITLIFDNGVAGDAANNAADWTFQFDDIQQIESCPTGGGGGVAVTDFESGTATFGDFEGGVGSVIDNPDATGINTSTKVGQMQKFAGATFAGTTLTLDAAETLAAGTSYTMKVRASRAVPVLFKLEGGAVGEVTVNHSGSGTWEELCFDFTGIAGNVSAITLIFDNGVAGAAGTDAPNWTFQFDDIQQIESCPTGGGGGVAVTDFESGTATFGDFEGGVGSVIDNPDATGINTSTKVGQMQKFAGATFAGTTLTLDAAETLAAGTSYTMKVRASRAVPVLFKLEGGAVGEVTVNHSGSGTWEELCFDFTGIAGNVSAITLIFDNGVAGAAGTDAPNWTFQFDDIQQIESCPTGGGGGGVAVTDFESGTATFGDFEGGVGSVIDNPDATGINTSTKVGQMQKFAGATFAGTTLTLDAAETLAAGTSYTMKVRASRAVPVLFKLEGGAVGEVTVNHSGSGTWEELCFDFTGIAGNVSAITLIFDNGVAGDAANNAADWTFQFDDIQQIESCPTGGGGGGVAVTDFESGTATFGDFEGGVGSVIDNPDATGINTSTKVGQMQKFAGATFAGTTLTLDAAETLAAGTSYTMKVRASRAVPVLFKLEGGAVGEVTVNHSGSGTWEELCFDFTGIAGNVSAITLIFDNGVAGDAANNAADWTFQFDDIQQIESCPTGGGGGAITDAVVDFEPGGLGADLTWAVFENGPNPALEFVVNPDNSGINNSATVAKFTARVDGATFAGTNTQDLPTFTLDASNAIVKIMVYKTVISDVGLKFEQGQASTGEIKVANTLTNQWEELTFDFSGKIGEPSSTDITGFVVFPDFDARAQDNVIYFDNISFSAVGGGGGTATVTDFESGTATFGDFEGGVGSVIDNPDATGINTSTKVGQMQKFAGATFAGTTLTLDAAETLAAGTSYTMKVRASRAVPVLFKLEGGAVGEVTVNHSGSGTWEELCFDFTGIAGNVSAITLIFDNGVAGDAANNAADWTFQFDDIQQIESCPTGGGGISLATVDFEASGTGAGFTWSVFENVDNPALEFVANPAADGVNGSATVAKFTARQAGASFAGTNTQDLPTFTLDASNAIVKIMVYKTVISDVGLKFEQGQASTGEIKVANSLINQWEELTFDFSGKIGEPSSSDITGFVVFPDFAARAQDNVIYFDNISFSASN